MHAPIDRIYCPACDGTLRAVDAPGLFVCDGCMWSSYDDPATNLSKIRYHGMYTWHEISGMMCMQWRSGALDDQEMRDIIKEIKLYDITQECSKGPNYTFQQEETPWTINNFGRTKAY